jgi:murein DD-endopeptidase MepM/ murein hydrolase activator NlpD
MPGYPLNSFFDHRYPIYNAEPAGDRLNFIRLDGQEFFTPTVPVDPNKCDTGRTCYTGHDGIDYGIPEGVPVRAAADGKVRLRYDDCGLVVLQHERNGSVLYTEYMHMSAIFVNEGDDITSGQVIGEVGDVADNVFCSSGGPHLHFGVRLYFGPGTSNTNIDPFGWWTGGEDPWETYSGGYESRWLWWGDEAGDGHHTVDDTESQAQLLYPSNWWHDENGYNGGAWWTYEVTSEEASTNWAIWGTYIETPGTYVIQAYWPASEEATRLAWYRIYTEQDGWIGSAWVDQAAHGGEWYTLGTLTMAHF